eukprot:GHVU01018238.1.p1 GENE.GHVU01018238.1~~GHVU01018238.1.p1  ORF type:complete len:116 (-),score=0.62 GHVU01018238.1:383-730(-)
MLTARVDHCVGLHNLCSAMTARDLGLSFFETIPAVTGQVIEAIGVKQVLSRTPLRTIVDGLRPPIVVCGVVVSVGTDPPHQIPLTRSPTGSNTFRPLVVAYRVAGANARSFRDVR